MLRRSLTVVALLLIAAPVIAQPPGRGFRGGPPGGPGGGPPFGGFSGGRPPFGGFPGGGFPGGGPPGSSSGGGMMTEMLRRMDANGNGSIDPDEAQGRARYMLERLSSMIPQIDLSKPISIDRLSRAMEEARSRRMREGVDSGRDSGRGGSPPAAEAEPLVPGFDIVEALPPPLGFGSDGEIFTATVTDADRREASERMRRYDSNRDGQLDQNELRRGRWSDDPMSYDRNRDGKVSISEMAVRYARRREAQSASTGSSSSSRDRSSRGGDRGGSDSGGGDPRSSFMARMMMGRFDRNRNGVVDGDELAALPNAGELDKDGDKKITTDELAAMSSRGGFMGRGMFGRGGGDDGRRGRGGGDGPPSYFGKKDEPQAPAKKVETRKSYRVKLPTERLSKDLPEWFARSDANEDGQIAMAEFSRSWSDSTVRDFAQFDLNGDGFITSKEGLRAVENNVQRGSFSSSRSTSRAPTTSSTSTSTSGSNAALNVSSSYLNWAKGVIKRYDKDGDGVLVESEWSSMSKNPAAGDANGDGKVTAEELAVFSSKK